MRITIIHTPADSEQAGLLNHLREILERGSVEVRAMLCGDGYAPRRHGAEIIEESEFSAALSAHFGEWSPDAIVMSDRLNGSKHLARGLARTCGVGVLTLKETVFPDRAYFAPDPATNRRERKWKPLEEFERFRLNQFLDDGSRLNDNDELYEYLAEIKPILLIVDHSSEYDAFPENWHMDVVKAVTAAGGRVLTCERERDICTPESCEQKMILHGDPSPEGVPCEEVCMGRAIRACRCMITNGSLLGLKALYVRKRVFVVGECVYSGMGFTHDIPFGGNFTLSVREALETADLDGPPEGHERFLYDFIFRDLLTLEGEGRRFAAGEEGRVIDALFRALPIERGARVLAGG